MTRMVRDLLVGGAWAILCGFIGVCMVLVVVFLVATGISR